MAKVQYEWWTDGAKLTYSVQGEGPSAPKGLAHTYIRGSSKDEKGGISAVFDGLHGFTWRNATDKHVMLKLTAWGQFTEFRKM